RFIPQKLPQADKRLHSGELRLRDVTVKLQQLYLDLEKVALADVACLVAGLADVHRVLKTLQILPGKREGGFGELPADELRSDVEGDTSVFFRHRRARHRRRVFGRLQAVLALSPALEQVADTGVELRRGVDVVGAEFIRVENRQKLRVERERGIGAQVRGNLRRFVLLDHR